MPSKRTNDSVDRILADLNQRQAADGVRASVTDHQVDEILRSVGISTTPRCTASMVVMLELVRCTIATWSIATSPMPCVTFVIALSFAGAKNSKSPLRKSVNVHCP